MSVRPVYPGHLHSYYILLAPEKREQYGIKRAKKSSKVLKSAKRSIIELKKTAWERLKEVGRAQKS